MTPRTTTRTKAGKPNPTWSRIVSGSKSRAEVSDRLWPALSSGLAGPITPAELAGAARLTTGSAQSLLAEWAEGGRLDRRVRPGKHGSYEDRYALPGTFVRVLVTGSRTWDDRSTLDAALHALAAEHGPRLVLVHGGCRSGADTLADDWCRRTGTPVERWAADWSTGRGAGMTRNAAMVASGPAACVAFLAGDTAGTVHCAAAAETAGIPTTRHRQAAEPGCAGKRARDPEPVLRSGRSTERPGSPLLAAALVAVGRGWHVFPLRPDSKLPAFPDHTEGRCTGPASRDPRCARAGRHVKPEERATCDPDRIRRAWSTRPYGIGVACGPSGLLVVDLDQPKPDETTPADWRIDGVAEGSDVLAVLAERAGQPYPGDTHAVRTGRGGTHLYFTHPAGSGKLGNTTGRLGWLIDTRGHGGYVVGAGSTVDRRPYMELIERDPAPLPGWLTDALTPTPAPHVGAVVALPAGRLPAYLTAALTAETAAVAAATEGSRNRTLFDAAASLGRLVAGGALPADLVTAQLEAAAAAAGLEARETDTTIRSGLAKGARRPRRPGQAAA